MRFDLTHAAYRVLERAATIRVPHKDAGISAPTLLLALFDEDESRAADWLAEAGLSKKSFEIDFLLESGAADSEVSQIIENHSILQSPISAPSFPVGNYGIPPGFQSETIHASPYKVEATSEQAASAVSYPNLDEQNRKSESDSVEICDESSHDVSQQDESLELSVCQNPKKFYSPRKSSVYSLFPSQIDRQKRKTGLSANSFFLDETPVNFGRMEMTLEKGFETISLQFSRFQHPDQRQRVRAANGAIATIMEKTGNSTLLLATEHLLLLVSLDDGDVGRWLRDHQLDFMTLYERIEQSITTPRLDLPAKENADLIDSDIDSDLIKTDFHRPESNLDDAIAFDANDAKISLKNELVTSGIIRLIDAAENRAREACRVLEDFTRFVLDDAAGTELVKNFRHELRKILSVISFADRLCARETQNDIGTELEGQNEYIRKTPHDVLDSNSARLQESLRSLEEYTKLIAPTLSRQLEHLRYQSYTLHKRIFEMSGDHFLPPMDVNIDYDAEKSNAAKAESVVINSAATDSVMPKFSDTSDTIESVTQNNEISNQIEILKKPENQDIQSILLLIRKAKLYALIPCFETESAFSEYAKKLIAGGVDMFQLRDKSAMDQLLLNRCRLLRKIIKQSEKQVILVMNDRPDLAIVGGADGVHVGQDEMPLAEVRKLIGHKKLIGVSTHNIEQVRCAISGGADYIGVGPVFPSDTKVFSTFPGLDFLKEVVAEKIDGDANNGGCPAFAIGGITEENVSQIVAVGLNRVALSSELLNAESPQQKAENIRCQLELTSLSPK
ncbi:MAG: thiamine phosphate synthase [Thermoguttaceae bacterium]